MRQQVGDLADFLRLQTHKHALEIGIRIVPIQPCRLDRAYDGGRALTVFDQRML